MDEEYQDSVLTWNQFKSLIDTQLSDQRISGDEPIAHINIENPYARDFEKDFYVVGLNPGEGIGIS